MLQFAGITGYDQMIISSKADKSNKPTENNKWSKQKRETFNSSDAPKILVTQRHVYAAHAKSVIVLDTKTLSDPTANITFEGRRDFKIDKHTSTVTCFGVEEKALLLCSCSDEHVFLSKWDDLLGHWDTKGISEGDGRILSCSVAFQTMDIYLTLFKSDVLIVYRVSCAHSPLEPGPLILNSIECYATLEKVKELTSWSRSLIVKQNFVNIIGIACGNTVSVKLWEVCPEKGENQIKLKSHRMVSYLKTIAGADLVTKDDDVFVLVVGNDGVSEVFSMTEDSLILLYRFKIEEPEAQVDQTKINANATTLNIQVDSRILCAKFFLVNFSKGNNEDNVKGNKLITDYDMGGGGDAKFDYDSFSKLSDIEKEKIIGNESEDELESGLCPKLILAAVTTRGTFLIDVVSGQFEMSVSHTELLKDDTIFIQNAEMTIDSESNEFILAMQSCLSRVIFARKFKVNIAPGSNSTTESEISLIPRETLSAKSVLRKKIKSPPRQIAKYPNMKGDKNKGLPKSPGTLPSWARARSRPQLKSSATKTKISIPLSARSHTSLNTIGESNRGFLNIEGGAPKTVPIIATGSYEDDDINFQKSQKTILPNIIPQGISILRIAVTNNGKHLAFGGSFSPLVITKTRPFQPFRTFKDVSKVTSAHFNFEGNLLVVASGDCRTTLVDWRNCKELLAFDFSTKFNEHVHSQFYFMDKFILQPEENKVVLYSYAERDNGFIKLKAGEFPLAAQNITALNAANRFYSNMIIAGLSNKSIQIFDTNSEKVAVNIPNTHTKPLSCIRVNEAPVGPNATSLCDIFLTSTFSSFDPIKLWDIRSAKCIMRISDINQTVFVPTIRPNLSPCGRYIISGFEDNTVCFYDVRKVKNRLHTVRKVGSTILDCCFDSSLPMVWGGCRNGSVVNFHIP